MVESIVVFMTDFWGQFMPKPTKEWSKPYLGISHYTGQGYHAIARQWDLMVDVSILPLNTDNTWKSHSSVDHKVFDVGAIETAKKWAENWTPGMIEV
jgi:hypothetical protein